MFAVFALMLLPVISLADVIVQRTRTVIVRVPVVNDVIYSVGERYIPCQKNEKIQKNEKVGLSDEDIKRIADEVARKLKSKDFNLIGDEGGPKREVISDKEKSELKTKVFAIFNSSNNGCIDCHKPGANKPGVQLFNADRTLFVNSDPKKEFIRRSKIVDACDASIGGTMPKGGIPLAPEQLAILKLWRDLAKE